ncbi:MAG: 4Fe-4S dicluster domain-containing protein [Chloroflexota bacterium]|nr:4Fe-4S dicluster domain-containing protein [Chloroflexota bacterium]
MVNLLLENGDLVVIEQSDFQQLLDVLAERTYQVVGPTIRDSAIIYDEMTSYTKLPIGWTDVQGKGTYRLKRREDDALFGYTVGPHSWKKYLHPPVSYLWRTNTTADGFQVTTAIEEPPKLAFIGVRACELQAIAAQDQVFLQGRFVDADYKARRENIFVVAVNCVQAGGTCFCASLKTGPKATSGFDLALTEVLTGTNHYFLVEIGSSAGADVMQAVTHQPASPAQIEAAEALVEATTQQMGRTLEPLDLKELLYNSYEHPQWDELGERCLGCGSCTMVCPTCFCTTTHDTIDVTGETTAHSKKWDSCFTMTFSYIHGGNVRTPLRSRYRQWLMHKFATWLDQFGRSGCVGCGRCITWCPAYIDITEEIRAIQESTNKQEEKIGGKL